MGVAGPVLVHGQHAKGLFYVPMATSEGALIRSYERGMVALTRAGGVQTAVLEDENQIAPDVFFRRRGVGCGDLPGVGSGANPQMQAAAETTTGHGKLKKLKCYQVGARCW